jgi:hypothetical protein
MLTLILIAKIAIIFIIVFPLLFLTGPLENPFYEIFKLEDSKIKLFVDYLGLHNDWGVFTDGPTMNFWDLRIIARSDKETFTWYVMRDDYIGDLKIHTDLSKLTIATYYESWSEYCYDTIILREVKKFFKKRNLKLKEVKIDEVLFSSRGSEEDIQNRRNPIKVDKGSHWRAKS